MAELALSPEEGRLATFCRIFAALYAAGAAMVLFWPDGRGAFDALAALLLAMATSCAVTAGRPRERRHAVLPAAVGNLAAGAMALLRLLAGGSGPFLAPVAACGLVLFLVTIFIYRAAAPGVHSAPAQSAPAPAGEEAKIQLKVSKS